MGYFAGFLPLLRMLRSGRYFPELYLMGSDRSACILVLEQYTDAPRQGLHPLLQGRRGSAARCRVRIYLPDNVRDAPVVICSELPNNPGGSITNSVEAIAAGVIRTNDLLSPLVWVEHWFEERTDDGEETFDLVAFSSYEVVERVPYLGETRAWIGDATWKRLDRVTVEVLVGGKV
jgi:hypothetical protein